MLSLNVFLSQFFHSSNILFSHSIFLLIVTFFNVFPLNLPFQYLFFSTFFSLNILFTPCSFVSIYLTLNVFFQNFSFLIFLPRHFLSSTPTLLCYDLILVNLLCSFFYYGSLFFLASSFRTTTFKTYTIIQIGANALE